MTSKAVTGVKIVDGKLVRKIGFRAGIKKRAADRKVKAWKALASSKRPA